MVLLIVLLVSVLDAFAIIDKSSSRYTERRLSYLFLFRLLHERDSAPCSFLTSSIPRRGNIQTMLYRKEYTANVIQIPLRGMELVSQRSGGVPVRAMG